MEGGLIATLIEGPETFPETQNAPPKSHYDACAAYPDPSNGNAAGKHGLDLEGANTKPPAQDHGAMYGNTQAPASAAPKPAQPQAPAPAAPKPKPNHPEAPVPQQPAPAAPEVAPQQAAEPVEVVPVYEEPVEPDHDNPVYAQSEDTDGPWPHPKADKGHTQVGDGSDGLPTFAHSEDTKGPWPNPHDNGPHNLPDGYHYWEQYEK